MWYDIHMLWVHIFQSNYIGVVPAYYLHHIDESVQKRHKSSVLAMELCLSCTIPSICFILAWLTFFFNTKYPMILIFHLTELLYQDLSEGATLGVSHVPCDISIMRYWVQYQPSVHWLIWVWAQPMRDNITKVTSSLIGRAPIQNDLLSVTRGNTVDWV